MTIDVRYAAIRSSSSILPAMAASNANPASVPRHMPLMVPTDQAYYWSTPWQESERRALADVKAGRTTTFADPAAAIRHLLDI